VLWDDPAPTGAAVDPQPTLLRSAVEKIGGNGTLFNRQLMSRLNKLPVVDPAPSPPLPLTQSYHSVLREAQNAQKQQNDQYVAIDHLILALIKVDHSEMKDLLKAAGVDGKALEAEVRRKRGGRKVDSKGAEGQFEALTKCE